MNNIIKSWNGRTIRIRSDRYVSLTDMAQASSKNVNDFLRLDKTKSYLNTLSSKTGYPVMAQEQGFQALVEVKKGGATPSETGTWGHPKVSIRFAQWCSDEFAVQVDIWIDELLTTGRVELPTNTPAPKNCTSPAPQFIARKLNGFVVEQRIADGYINATALSYAYQQLPGKRREVQNWLKNKATQELMEQISAPLFLPPIALYQITNGNVWLHPNLVVNFAFWTSEEIGPIVEKWVKEWNSKLVPNQPTNQQLGIQIADSFSRIQTLQITLDSLWETVENLRESTVEKLLQRMEGLEKATIEVESQTVQEIGGLQLKVESLSEKISHQWGQTEGFAEMMKRVEKLLEEKSSTPSTTPSVTVNVSTISALPSLDARQVIRQLINDYSARTGIGQMQLWQKLYREFSRRYHVCIDQCQNKKQSKLEVAEGMGMIRELYAMAAEMFA
ncbi:KilA-N domain-containing protein [Kamptonema sp. UHCC 0994]|uniref:KilA-N domain-containing protein n=1 Tax=Kamptonema sp. UHCC 0994 TaxID=3031329 RepID=UPI0023B90420|nr:KilA-N domain-containing protein [Kamptonema sp. UHCC 0994]MDF0553124.1 KilA-N domain-containing protein [Kamptonema sp. UHCC 0994]